MMGKYGEMTGPDTVRFERTLPGPLARVWRYFRDSSERASWLCGGEIQPRVGGHVDLLFNISTLSDEPDDPPPEKYEMMAGDIAFTGEVTQWSPPMLLAHTWVYGGEASEACYELSEADGNVLLVVTHSRLPSMEDAISACGGWHTHLDILDDLLQGKSRRAFWKTHTAIEAEYAERLQP
jgi:uncharacterized protein YndB with AHSA1/START domain